MANRKVLYSLLCFMLLIITAGCSKETLPKTNLVFIEEGTGFSVQNNGQRINYGESASFVIDTESGISIVGCDYSDKFDISIENSKTILTIDNVIYPVRIKLYASSRNCTVTYDPNGGTDKYGNKEPITKRYSLLYHFRPNVSNGADMFYRIGYTLTAWNTKADGSGDRIGLGSRVTGGVDTLTLYAVWEKWTDESSFKYTEEESGITITSVTSSEDVIAIPETINNLPVRAIDTGAFKNISASTIVLNKNIESINDGAFDNCSLSSLVLFDNASSFSDSSFVNCDNLKTLYINAVEAPFGYVYRRESCYADKIDLLIMAKGKRKLVFYGGCSMWYNLNCQSAYNVFGNNYQIINVALNGSVNSSVQMQIMAHYLEKDDILFHTPEFASTPQLMTKLTMDENDVHLWCGLENNYDLFSLVDLQTVSGVFDSFCHYLSTKNTITDYDKYYTEDYVVPFMDSYGGVSLYRSKSKEKLADDVTITPNFNSDNNLSTLCSCYEWLQSLGVKVYVSYACVNTDALSEGKIDHLDETEETFRNIINSATGTYPIGKLQDFLYTETDFYDTNYHLLSEPAKKNTEIWLTYLKEQMIKDGLWKED